MPYKSQATPDLPSERVSEDPPFTHVGLDFAGPLNVVNEQANGSSKVYVCLLTCASTRAIHLELCKSLDVQDFSWPLDGLLVDEGSPQLSHQTTQKLSSLRAKKSEGSQDPTKCCVTLLIKESPETSSLKGLPRGEVSGSA